MSGDKVCVVITGAGSSGGTHVLQREQNDGDILS